MFVFLLGKDQPALQGIAQVRLERDAIVLSVKPLQDETAQVVELDAAVPTVRDQRPTRSLIAGEL